MIRPFHLRDVTLVHRLAEGGSLLQAEAALTSSPHPVRRALVNMLVGGRYSTYVWKSAKRDAAAFVQLRWEDGNPSAHLVCLGSESNGADEGDGEITQEDIWLPLLDQLVQEAGRLGVHNLIAEADESGPELPLLRRAGFVVYTRQDIWISDGSDDREPLDILKPHQSIDDWDILVLYSNIVPGLIQSVEPNPPLNSGENWVLRENHDLAALIHVTSGPIANWMRLLIHPNARTKPSEIIQGALSVQQSSAEHPVYCCVRRYQSWLQGALEKAGFRLWGSQAVMVKHIAQQVERREPIARGVLEPQTVPGSTPLIQGFSQPGGGNHNSH